MNNNEKIVRDFYQLINNHDVASLSSYIDEDYCHEWIGAGPPVTKKEWLKRIAYFLESFPDYSSQIDNVFVIDDLVILEYRGTGTQKKEWLGVPPTNKMISWQFMALIKMKNGKLGSFREYLDNAAFYKQVKILSVQFFQ